jgi:hypothetical protein
LIAEILPASSLPTQIVIADRYVSGGGDPGQIEQQPWDASVQALAHYPNVLSWMDQNLNWTTELGQAFLNQQQDVMDSIQRLRASAQNLGNLQPTPQQQVVDDNGTIEILPADPDVVYVPEYQPAYVYYQGGYGLTFGGGFPIGVWLHGDFDWRNHHLITWDRDHPRPNDWWHERPDQRDNYADQHAAVWRPEDHRPTVAVNQGDRGWNNQPVARDNAPRDNRPVPQPHAVTVIGDHGNTPRPAAAPRPEARPEPAPVESRPTPAPVQHYAPISRPASTGAFIGVQSSQQTRDYSNRGQQSMQTVTHSAPPMRSAPSGGGGGGGNHGPSQKH